MSQRAAKMSSSFEHEVASYGVELRASQVEVLVEPHLGGGPANDRCGRLMKPFRRRKKYQPNWLGTR